MPCVQRDLMLLPDEVWARVLSKLPQKDLLQAHLVSKDFVRLNQLSQMELDWRIESSSAASSLALFVRRHLRHQQSPKLNIHISKPLEITLSVSLACDCAHLQRLDILENFTLLQAEACLRMLPCGLLHLALSAPSALLDDRSWSSLTALTSLHLSLPEKSPFLASGTGLALAHSLGELSLSMAGVGSYEARLLRAATFSHECITWLTLDTDFFEGWLDLRQFPKIMGLELDSHMCLPHWLQHYFIG